MEKNIYSVLTIVALLAPSVLVFHSCEKDTSAKEKNVKFNLSHVDSDDIKSMKDSGKEPEAVLVTIEKEVGTTVYENEKIQLFDMSESYISEPISLQTNDEYKLTKFIVLNGDDDAVYASPLENSSNAYLVENPLPKTFGVEEDEATKLNPEVLTTEHSTPDDFGYATFSLDLVETFDFRMGVFVYDETDENHVMISATMTIHSEGETLYEDTLAAKTNTITVNDGYNNYILSVEKEGYQTHVDTFTNAVLKSYYSSEDEGPLEIVLNEKVEDEWDVNNYNLQKVTNAKTDKTNRNDRTYTIFYEKDRNVFWRAQKELYKSSDNCKSWTDMNISDDLNTSIRSLFYDENTKNVYVGTGYDGILKITESNNLDTIKDSGDDFACYKIGSFQDQIWIGENTKNPVMNYHGSGHQISIYYKDSSDKFHRVPLSGDYDGMVVGESSIINKKLYFGRRGNPDNSYIHVIDSDWNEVNHKKIPHFKYDGLKYYKGNLYFYGTDRSTGNVKVGKITNLNTLDYTFIWEASYYTRVRGFFTYDDKLWGVFRNSDQNKSALYGNLKSDFSNVTGYDNDPQYIVAKTDNVLANFAGLYFPYVNNSIFIGSARNSGAIFKLTKTKD